MRPDSRERTSNRLSWWLGAIGIPLVLIGALLGAVGGADTALERVPVALVNNDELVEQVGDDGEEEIILASRPLVTELVGNEDTQVNWIITGSDQATRLLEVGEVYAIVEIPENFSRAVTSLEEDVPEQAQFSIETDASHSYLASVLADQIGQGIAQTINDEFGRELTKGLFDAIVDLGDGVVEAADAADEVAEGTRELADGVQTLREGSAELRSGTDDLVDGYKEFDDGVGEYLQGVRDLSAGTRTLRDKTSGLPQLTSGVESYTEGVTGLYTLLNIFSQATLLDGVTTKLGDLPGTPASVADKTVKDVIADLGTLSSEGPALVSGVDTGISGVRTGIKAIDDGADQLSDNSYALEEGSAEILSGVSELNSGVAEFDDGVEELRDGVNELADGMDEFADGLSEGAQEITDEGPEVPSDSTLDTLISPVGFSGNDANPELRLADTVSSLIIPIALWFTALLSTLRLPALSPRVLGSTAPTSRLYRWSLAPVFGAVGAQAIVATVLMHTLGGVSWSAVGWTSTLIVATAAAFSALHLAVWMWRPQLLASLSIGAGIIQVITIGVIPLETLPGLYQALASASPMAWSSDGLIAAIAQAGDSRWLAALWAMGATIVAGLLAARIALWRAREQRVREVLGLSDPM